MTTELKIEQDRSVSFRPLGEGEDITLTIPQVRKFIAARTKLGHEPTEADVVKFVMLCKSRQLNPWVGDAYLIGYDGKDGPVFSLVTAIQALLKRAESCHEFDGLESGVIVATKGGTLTRREGGFLGAGETLVGAWARAHRRDRSVPTYVEVTREHFDSQNSMWRSKPTTMLTKVAKAAALREMFPSQCGGLYVDGDIAAEPAGRIAAPKQHRLRQFAPESIAVDDEPATEPEPIPVDDSESLHRPGRTAKAEELISCGECGASVPASLAPQGLCPECEARQ